MSLKNVLVKIKLDSGRIIHLLNNPLILFLFCAIPLSLYAGGFSDPFRSDEYALYNLIDTFSFTLSDLIKAATIRAFTEVRLCFLNGVHPNQIGQWRKQLLRELPALFSDRRRKAEKVGEELTGELYRQIGQLKVELEWLKKKSQLLG